MLPEMFRCDYGNFKSSILNNSAKRSVKCADNLINNENDVIVLPGRTALHNKNNMDKPSVEDIIDNLLDGVHSSPKFKANFAVSSLFVIGQGAFGLVFSAVTKARGDMNNPKYPETLCKFLQKIWKTNKVDKKSLTDAYRDDQCLDLVSIKVEQLTISDVECNSVGTIHLVREFYILLTLFSQMDTRFSMVGFPLPIDFGYIGNNRIAKNLDRVIVYDPLGQQSSFSKTYFDNFTSINIKDSDVTYMSYFAMELVGPNVDQWKEFFVSSHGNDGSLVFSPQTVFKLMDQLLCRLWVMHRKNIVHLDLKPDNICMGIGKMCNTVYLVDYGLSKICSDNKPDVTLGTRKYMSVGVMNMHQTNYTMDVESWFYILLVLLVDDLPWSDRSLSKDVSPDLDGGAREEKLMTMVNAAKKSFWGDDGYYGKKMWHNLAKKIELVHGSKMPDIASILTEMYDHIRKMRNDFQRYSSMKMHADIRDEDSDLSKRYGHLRKLLLYPYDFNFSSRDSCFSGDKDLVRRQEDRKAKYQMLFYCDPSGRNWQWDWDQWFDEEFPNEAK